MPMLLDAAVQRYIDEIEDAPEQLTAEAMCEIKLAFRAGARWARDERLIAAAPDLLAACESALMQFEHNGDECPEDRAVLDELQSAIAKATPPGPYISPAIQAALQGDPSQAMTATDALKQINGQ